MHGATSYVDDESHELYQAAIESVRVVVADLVVQHCERCDAHHLEPTPTSPAMADHAASTSLAKYLRGEPIVEAIGLGNLQLVGAEDFIGAIDRLLVMREPVLYADRALGRSALEAAAGAAWLLEPDLSVTMRVSRSTSHRIDTLEQTARVVAGSSQEATHLARRDDLVRQSHKAGLDIQRDRKGKRILGVGEHRPTSSAIMEYLWSPQPGDPFDLGRFAQRFLSLFVHANPAGLLQASMDELPPGIDAPPPSALPGSFQLALGSNSSHARLNLAIVGGGYLIAANRNLRYMGYLDEAWSKTINNAGAFLRTIVGDQPSVA